MASNLLAMASNLLALASNLEAMASNLLAMASNLLALASNLEVMASNLLAMPPTYWRWLLSPTLPCQSLSTRRWFLIERSYANTSEINAKTLCFVFL